VELIPGGVPEFLSGEDVALFRAEDRVFEAMVDGWRAQMLARGLTVDSIRQVTSAVVRFQEFTNDYPWSWTAHDVDEFFAMKRSGQRSITVSTLRAYSGAIRGFCSYVCDGRYGWLALCERTFNDVPSQVVFEWNTPRHTTDDARSPGRRALTKSELQRFFDAQDDLVDAQHARGSKRWLPALRDSVAFKVCFAFGLRRRELAKLEYVDFAPNPHIPKYGGFGAVQVRWAKGTAGSGPRHRTVLTVPEYDWVVELLRFWLSPQGRQRFATADRSTAMWPSERSGDVVQRTFDRSFAAAREAAGLPRELTLHALRHSFTTHLIEAGYDPLFVQEELGHTNASTTALYTSVSSNFKQKSIQKMIAQRVNGADTSGGDGNG